MLEQPDPDDVRPAPDRPRFTVSTAEDPHELRLRIAGELDLASAPLLREATTAAVASGAPSILVDLSRLEALDSTGLQVLLGLHESVRGTDGRLRFVPGPARVQRVFELCGLLEILTFLPEGAATE